MNKRIQRCVQVCNRLWCNIARCLLGSCAISSSYDLYFFVAICDEGFTLSFGLLFQFVEFRVHVSSTHSTVQCFGFNRLQQLISSFCSKPSNISLKTLSILLPSIT